jgi:hypothetical protein
MALTQLLPQTGVTGTVGTSTLVGTSDGKRQLQFNPQPGVGFTGTLLVEGSAAGNPGSNDWVQLAEVIFSAHTTNFAIEMLTEIPWMRVRVGTGTLGAVSAYLS